MHSSKRTQAITQKELTRMQEDPNNNVKGADHQHKKTNTKGAE